MPHTLLGGPGFRPPSEHDHDEPAPLGTGELVRALVLGTLAAVLASSGSARPYSAQTAGAIVLYLGVFAVHRPCALLSIFAYLGVSYAAAGGMLGLAPVRIALFSLLLCMLRGERVSPYPLLAIVPLWQFMFVLYGLRAPFLEENLPTLTPGVVAQALGESASLVVLPFLATCFPLMRMLRLPGTGWKSEALVFHLLLVPVVGLVAVGLMLVRIKTGLSWEGFFERFDVPVRLAGLGSLTLCFICVVLAFTLSLQLVRLFRLMVPRLRDAGPSSLFLLFDLGDLEEEIAIAENVSSELEASAEKVQQIARAAELRERELLAREHSYQDVIRLLDRSGWGVVAVNDAGVITLLSRTLRSMLGLPNAAFRGKHLGVLNDLRHPWATDIYDAITWARANPHLLRENGPRSHRSRPANGISLTLYIYASEYQGAKELKTDMSSSGGHLRKELLTVVLVRKDSDLHELQTRLLTPFPLEAGGCLAADLLEELRDELVHIGNNVSLLTTELHNLRDDRGQFFKSSSVGVRTLELLAGIDQTSRVYRDSSKQILKRLAPVKSDLEEIDLTAGIGSALTYLYELLGLDRTFTFSRVSEGTTDEASPSERVVIHYPRAEFDGVIRYLLVLLRTIVHSARDLQVDVAEEEISPQAASFVPGASAGSYARLTFRHPGQSIGAHVLTAQRTARWFTNAPDPVELAIFLCSRQLRRLGGFLSVQSSQAKGTEVTVYMPRDLRDHQTQPLSESGVFRSPAERGSAVPFALFVSDDDRLIRSVRDQLTELGYQCVVKIPDEFLLDLDQSLEFGGSGFLDGEHPENRHEVFSAVLPHIVPAFDLSPFDVIVVDGGASHPPPRPLIESIARDHPTKRLVLLTPAEHGPIDLPKPWATVRRDAPAGSIAPLVRADEDSATNQPAADR